jgi:heme/copper-type cytochrome/quinol oxidase subunit 3
MDTTLNTPKIELRDVPQGRLGMWILIAGELVIFGGLIACYLLLRFRYPEWGAQAAHTSTMMGAINTFVLLTSSYFAVRAHGAALQKNYSAITGWMSATIACGLIFLVIKAIEYSTEIGNGFTVTAPSLVAEGGTGATFWAFYYLMTGLHGAHVLVGMIVLLVIMLQARKGKNLHRVELAGMYWHMVDIVWIFLFPMLYIAK